MKNRVSCTSAADAYVCFAVVIFLTIALLCNGTPARTTAFDSVSLEGSEGYKQQHDCRGGNW